MESYQYTWLEYILSIYRRLIRLIEDYMQTYRETSRILPLTHGIAETSKWSLTLGPFPPQLYHIFHF